MVPSMNGGAQTPVWVRLRMRKAGPLQFISHLDFLRTLQKALVRAGLPLWYSMGYNPIPKISVAAPLSVGVSSECELVDVRLTRPVDPERAVAALRENLPVHMAVTELYVPETKLSALAWIGYEVQVFTDGASDGLAAACQDFLASPVIMVLKKTKSGERESNIRPQIKEAACRYDPAADCLALRLVLSAQQASFLNPEYVLGALKSACGIAEGAAQGHTICRTGVFAEDMQPFR
ncbi:MAG: TIGR03936 family radical SAM-associated protein [Eubacteriales bacterium]